ncbi:hypothetical protein BOS5A_210259 [Bosea sp. EC-HK365B]|nr:hypothetical protein BOSE21B_30795 [Bosea sp. 21B]VVT59468.1 hypothetical protein BOS5A_210259 [Bosea sp. EC-HK365B]VXB92438.1 hypothetical protein BOSE127_160152 [Bosea sp. 127]
MDPRNVRQSGQLRLVNMLKVLDVSGDDSEQIIVLSRH